MTSIANVTDSPGNVPVLLWYVGIITAMGLLVGLSKTYKGRLSLAALAFGIVCLWVGLWSCGRSGDTPATQPVRVAEVPTIPPATASSSPLASAVELNALFEESKTLKNTAKGLSTRANDMMLRTTQKTNQLAALAGQRAREMYDVMGDDASADAKAIRQDFINKTGQMVPPRLQKHLTVMFNLGAKGVALQMKAGAFFEKMTAMAQRSNVSKADYESLMKEKIGISGAIEEVTDGLDSEELRIEAEFRALVSEINSMAESSKNSLKAINWGHKKTN